MAHAHFGNLADIFKHLALAEILGTLRPGEYWESHAGAAFNTEIPSPPPERTHGIHTFIRLANENEALRCSLYFRALTQVIASTAPAAGDPAPKKIIGSPLLARLLMPETARRLLFCDIDADCLSTIRTPLTPASPGHESRTARAIPPEKIECVQDDGVSVLRGAGILLPEPWTPSTLVFIDPEDMTAPTDSGISPLTLACELAARGIVTLLWYGFNTDAERAGRHRAIQDALEKSRLTNRGVQRFQGSLTSPGVGLTPTQWGWGILTFNVPSDSLARLNLKLRALESVYRKSILPGWANSAPGSGAWKLTQTAL